MGMALTDPPSMGGAAGRLRVALLGLGMAGALLLAIISPGSGAGLAIAVLMIALAAEAIGRGQFYAGRPSSHF
jgi:hypothetical protein